MGATRGEKNRRGEGRAAAIQLAEELFFGLPVKYSVLLDGPKNEVCEVAMEYSFGEDCFNFHRSL